MIRGWIPPRQSKGQRSDDPEAAPGNSPPPGLATTMRMAARPSSCLQRTPAAPFVLSAAISISTTPAGHALRRRTSAARDFSRGCSGSRYHRGMHWQVAAFISRRWCVPEALIEVDVQPMPGGLESAIVRARIALGESQPSIPSTLVVKELRTGCEREADIYELLWRHLNPPPAVRMFGRDTSEHATYLYLGDAEPFSSWPGPTLQRPSWCVVSLRASTTVRVCRRRVSHGTTRQRSLAPPRKRSISRPPCGMAAADDTGIGLATCDVWLRYYPRFDHASCRVQPR